MNSINVSFTNLADSKLVQLEFFSDEQKKEQLFSCILTADKALDLSVNLIKSIKKFKDFYPIFCLQDDAKPTLPDPYTTLTGDFKPDAS